MYIPNRDRFITANVCSARGKERNYSNQVYKSLLYNISSVVGMCFHGEHFEFFTVEYKNTLKSFIIVGIYFS